MMKPSEKPRNPPLTSVVCVWIYLAVCSHQPLPWQSGLEAERGVSTWARLSLSPAWLRLTEGKNTSPTCHGKCLTVSEGKVFKECVCYRCISLSGLPVQASTGLTWQSSVGNVLPPPGALKPQTRFVLGASVQRPRPPSLINTTGLHQTEQITLPAPMPPHPATTTHPKTSLHYLSTGLQTLSPQWYICCEGRLGEAGPWLLIWSYLFSSACHTLSYNLGSQCSPFYQNQTIHLLHTDGWIPAMYSTSDLRRGNSHGQKTEWALSTSVHCCGPGQGLPGQISTTVCSTARRKEKLFIPN